MSSRIQSPPASAPSGASASRSAIKRLLREVDTWQEEKKEEKGIERLGPVNEDDLFTWEAVINGNGIGCGYDGSTNLFPLYHHTRD